MVTARLQLPRFMSRSDYVTWAEQRRDGRWERHGNQVVALDREGSGIEETGVRVRQALHDTIKAANVHCGVAEPSVRIGVEDDSDYGPAAVVVCDPRTGGDRLMPVVVVEVAAPFTSLRDLNIKLADYFLLPSVRHCLVVASDAMHVVHHRRGNSNELITSEIREGEVILDPPGLTVAISAFYSDHLPET